MNKILSLLKKISFKKYNKVYVYIILLIISILISIPFYMEHYATDDFMIMNNGYQKYSLQALSNGRPLETIILIFLSKLNISYPIVKLIVLFISDILISICMYIFYYYFYKRLNLNDKSKKIVLAIATLLIFFNRMVAQNMLFFENMFMIFALLLSVIASFVYVSDRKYKGALTFIILTLGMFSYQATLNFFVPLTIILIALKDNFNKKISIKEIIKVFTLYIVPFILCYIYVKYIYLLGFNIDKRISGKLLSIVNIEKILGNLIYYILNYSIFILFGILFIYFSLKKIKSKNIKSVIFNITVIIISCFIACILEIAGNGSAISNRMVFSIGAIPGILLFLTNILLDIKYKKIFIFISIIILISEIAIYLNYEIKNLESTRLNKRVILEIKAKTLEYEKQNNIIVKNVAFYYDKYENDEFWGKNIDDFNKPELYTEWSQIACLNYYFNRKFNMTTENLKDSLVYLTNDWKIFDINQITFTNDTLNVCLF